MFYSGFRCFVGFPGFASGAVICFRVVLEFFQFFFCLFEGPFGDCFSFFGIFSKCKYCYPFLGIWSPRGPDTRSTQTPPEEVLDLTPLKTT